MHRDNLRIYLIELIRLGIVLYLRNLLHKHERLRKSYRCFEASDQY